MAKIKPDWVLESSWEVCNKLGGIYTVLSTRAKILNERLGDRLIFIGPDFGVENGLFAEDDKIYSGWRKKATTEGIRVRVGRWQIPGNPVAILVDFKPFFSEKNAIYAKMWEDFKVDSLHAYGDYDESCMFAIAAAKVVESLYKMEISVNTPDANVIYQCHEWMTGMGALYIKKNVPEIATIFTTHATTIGRSIAGNGKPLYDYLWAYKGDQMAGELNVASKHSLEKQVAYHVDCFTTVSDITARECAELLDKTPDVVQPNGFDNSFVPSSKAEFDKKRCQAREKLLKMAGDKLETSFDDDTFIISTSGRFEYHNKGLDMFHDAICRLGKDGTCRRKVLAFIFVPYNNATSIDVFQTDSSYLAIIPVAEYLPDYYDTIIGCDLCIYPSYYEPWGYTPLEAIAFNVPCITTDLAGFGLWAEKNKIFVKTNTSLPLSAVTVVHRSDYNFAEASVEIKDTIKKFVTLPVEEMNAVRKEAATLSRRALWKDFIRYYDEAYDIAFRNKITRIKK